MDWINVDKEEIFFPIRNRILSDKREDKTEENTRTNAREREREKKDGSFFVQALVFGDAFAFCGSFLLSWLLSA